MRSTHADEFNHNSIAHKYDNDVVDERHPIRAGYQATLDWVIKMADIQKDSCVLELGSGTGNLTKAIPDCDAVVCVDVSEQMEAIAQSKISHLKNRTFMKDDMLCIFEKTIGTFDVIISTYTIHHLTEREKKLFFREIWKVLNPGGRAVFGDLMLENESLKSEKIREYKEKGDNNTADGIEEEFFWFVDESQQELENLGFQVSIRRFSDLSFGILAQKPGDLRKK